jgi:hypothetical protein
MKILHYTLTFAIKHAIREASFNFICESSLELFFSQNSSPFKSKSTMIYENVAVLSKSKNAMQTFIHLELRVNQGVVAHIVIPNLGGWDRRIDGLMQA